MKRQMKRGARLAVMLLGLLVILGTCRPIQAELLFPFYGRVANESLTIRERPSRSVRALAVLQRDDIVLVTGQATGDDRNWYEVQFNGEGKEIKGYVLSDFIEQLSTSPDAAAPFSEEASASYSVKELALRSQEFGFTDENRKEPNPEERMAHNIYSDPDLSNTSGRFSAFSIDFMAEDIAQGTYWALCNWSMDVSSLQKDYTVTENGGAYAGLQNRPDGTKGIMSFWEIYYRDQEGKDHILNAHRIYPEGEENRFGGEGEGTNYIGTYRWKGNHWYRMLIRCYDDEAGYTIVEQWVMDLEQGDWELLSAFNTNLQHSCFIGPMSQFMENYLYEYSNAFRSFRYKNIFVKEHDSGKWIPITGATLSVDVWWDNKKGSYAFGADDTCLWGITCGYGTDVIKGNNHGPISKDYRIATDSLPEEPPQ